jgi:hypothetical protein
MPKISSRARYFPFPHNDLLFDARLDAIREEPSQTAKRGGGRGNRSGSQSDFLFDLFAFTPLSPVEPHEVDGRPHELVSGEYRPLRLRFIRAEWIMHTGPYERPDALPDDDHTRRIFSVIHGHEPKLGEYYWVQSGAPKGAYILRARGCALEEREGERTRATVVRRWSPPPPHASGLVPHHPMMHHRYAGDPVSIRLDGRTLRHRLFIGGLHHQRAERPAVDHVLNLCGVENHWVALAGRHPADRYNCKGEMSDGMGADELLEEAGWVVERLRGGRCVLVHCYAGINRSSSVCCAALMLLEGISADEALARVRERHPAAWPDPYHWFVLRGLNTPDVSSTPAPGGAPSPVAVSALRA